MFVKNKSVTLLTFIFFFGLFLRLYKLPILPPGFHVDEAKVAWNAVSLLHTGKDDWNHLFPLHYDSFGDFRPTGIIYATTPSVAIFKNSIFAVRFPSALLGSLTILIVYFLSRQLKLSNKISLISAFFLAISPWHISVSRATSEGIFSLALTSLGLIYFLRLYSKPKLTTFLLSSSFLLSSYFFYHTARMLTPIFLFAILGFQYLNIKKLSKYNLLITVLLLVTTLIFSISPSARGRFNQVSIFSDLDIKYELQKLPFEEGHNSAFISRVFNNKPILYTNALIEQYTQYISAKFLLVPYEAKPLRYNTVGSSLIFFSTFALLLIGICLVIRGKYPLLPLALFLLTPLPAALTTEDAPNLHRALYMVIFQAILVGMGVAWVTQKHKFIALTLGGLLIFQFVRFERMYAIHNPTRDQIPLSRNSGADEAAKLIGELQPKYKTIYVTNIPDSLFPWYAYSNNLNPEKFNSAAQKRKLGDIWSYENIVFTAMRCPSDKIFNEHLANTLAVDAEGCGKDKKLKLIKEVVRSGTGSTVYMFWTLP